MHDFDTNFDINLAEISKIEGAASLELKVRDKKIEDLKFSISEWKRFYTQAIRGKPIQAVPQLVDRICGTCSNAHLLCSIEAVEKAFKIKPSKQTMLLRKLLYYGLIIRDHGLHLYIFALPDIFKKNSILDFDEGDRRQKKLLDDAFSVKQVGNQLSIVVGGRAVHAPYPTIGGFLSLPKIEEIKKLRPQLLKTRAKVLTLIEVFAEAPFHFTLASPLTFAGLSSSDFSFLEGVIKTSDRKTIEEKDLGRHLEMVIIPYSQARGFKFDGDFLMVGALARLNVGEEYLHQRTKQSASACLKFFPSNNIFNNNLAQAIEMLHAIDSSIDIIDGLNSIKEEKPVKFEPFKSQGVGVIEAPRGTLYHHYFIDEQGVIEKGEIIVPTGQNQIVMERGIYELVEKLLTLDTPKDVIELEIEKLIRAFDPCMSCAAHFLKVNWR